MLVSRSAALCCPSLRGGRAPVRTSTQPSIFLPAHLRSRSPLLQGLVVLHVNDWDPTIMARNFVMLLLLGQVRWRWWAEQRCQAARDVVWNPLA